MDKKSEFEAGLPEFSGKLPASREKADAFLEEHAELARLQAEELRDELRLHHWRTRVEHWSGILKLSFEISLAILVLLVAVGIGAALWSAAHDKALVIESFSVPPDLAGRGLDGRAIAAHLQDKLAAMQSATQSVRPADSYSNDWGNDIKVQIPETGVSIGELHRLLVAWLGHQTHITGEVWRSNKGIAITTRTGAEGGITLTGAEPDFDALLQRTAESIYRRTQPYRYTVYLQYLGSPDWPRVRAIYQDLLSDPSPREQAWAYVGLSNIDSNNGDHARSLQELRLATAVLPNFALPYQNMEGEEASLSHEEAALRYAAMALRILPNDREIEPQLRTAQIPLMRGEAELLRNDYAAAARDYDSVIALRAPQRITETARVRALLAKAFLHDADGVRAAVEAMPPSRNAAVLANRNSVLSLAQFVLGHGAVSDADFQQVERALTDSARADGVSDKAIKILLSRLVTPNFTVALAIHGEFAKAHSMAELMPLDCDNCLRARAQIAAREKRWAAAQYWFERAVRHASSIAFGYSEWGRMLLAKGDLDGAIAKFAEAHRKQPHFADPLELWGEVLIAKNRSDLAVARFQEAARYAPNWGRLHLKWGEALIYSGHEGEARAEFTRAAQLDLTAAERAELKRFSHG